MLCSLWLLPLAQSFVTNTAPPKAHRRATPSGVEEKETPELDWRAFRAKLEGAGLDAADREAWDRDASTRGGWIHALPDPEAGGLLLALPFSATLIHAASPWRDDVLRFSTRRRMADARGAADGPRRPSRRGLRGDARRYADSEAQRIAATPFEDRTEKDLRFLADRASAIARARDVVLVLSADGDGGGAGLRLGRQDKCAPWGSRRRSAALYAFLEADDGGLADFHEFHAAFGSDVAVYIGSRGAGDSDWEGINWQGEALLLHARPGLAGAAELSPGCGIYRGGAAAAASMVARGDADAAEFAFFVGRCDFGPGELARAARDGLYQPAACAGGLLLGEAKVDDASIWRDLMRALGGASADVEALVRGARLPRAADDGGPARPDELEFGDS